jgi:hypothetical protein
LTNNAGVALLRITDLSSFMHSPRVEASVGNSKHIHTSAMLIVGARSKLMTPLRSIVFIGEAALGLCMRILTISSGPAIYLSGRSSGEAA